MELRLNGGSRKRIEEAIRQKYARVSVNLEGQFRYPTGRAGLEKLGYSPKIIERLPARAISTYCGVGNPFSLGSFAQGDAVLDLGCGGGADSLVAAVMVGSRGKVVGIDMTWEMLARAQESQRRSSLGNLFFQLASAEALPFFEESFDGVISNGVFNLILDKLLALKEAYRVLKPRGLLLVADQILIAHPPRDPEARIASWFR